ncbi:MAG TPA: class I SAM-dependent methyltransferase [Acidimicrobiia bacterium]|jgi:hypothetical protein
MTARARCCRNCGAVVEHVVLDLGEQPLSNSYVDPAALHVPEPHYPLAIGLCTACWLVQLLDDVDPAMIFTDQYAYFSSVSESWVAHAHAYAAEMTERLRLNDDSFVVEIASNDGYLLGAFVDRGIGVLGIEPSANTAAAAEARGVPTRVEFFGSALATSLRADGVRPELVVGNNVLAHVRDLDDFVRGLAILVGDGLLTMEFPHLLRLVEGLAFDTIYHEHYSYFSLLTARDVFERRGLDVVDVEELPTHGGSLRVHVRTRGRTDVSDRVHRLVEQERAAGLDTTTAYDAFASDVERIREELPLFLRAARADDRLVVGYGAPAKGNTLLNSCGVTSELLPFTVDRSPVKQGMLLPGSHVPIESPERLLERRPDYVLVLPWNLVDEITEQMRAVREWGGQFVVPIPRPHVVV